jgi:DNA-binding GntR family transcriptional regulator
MQVVEELRAIVRALTDRDAEKAAALTAEHVRNASTTAMHSLRESEATG